MWLPVHNFKKKNKCATCRRQWLKSNLNTEQKMKWEKLYNTGSECMLNSWPESSVSRGFKSKLNKLSKATSKNPSLMNTTQISCEYVSGLIITDLEWGCGVEHFTYNPYTRYAQKGWPIKAPFRMWKSKFSQKAYERGKQLFFCCNKVRHLKKL